MFTMRTFRGAGQRVLAISSLTSIALIAAACGTVAAHGPGAPGKTVTVTSPGPTHTVKVRVTPRPARTAPCSTADLKLTIGQENGAAGTVYYPVEFTNISSSTCTMYGFPGVAFVTSPGSGVIGAPAGRSAAAPALITLRPGMTAHATLAVSDERIADACSQHQVPVRWLQVYPPNQYKPLFVRFSPLNGVGCADKSLVVMSVTPVAWGATGP
jgi:Domain of unknown function (DUF4232)